MNVVLYMRYSSDKQTEQSIEGQERVCRAFCTQNNYRVIGTYIDRALSASKNVEKRLEFQRMLQDSSKGNFKAVIVYKLDRFARDRYDSAVAKRVLRKNGVRVISSTENISDSPEGIILESMLEGFNEYYSRELSQKVTRGMRESALKGLYTGGSAPLGYKVENSRLVSDPERSLWIKEAFERYANGERIKDIYTSFNERGYRTSRGSKFTKNSFESIFKNEKYIGIYKYMDVVADNVIEPIISKELFDMAQEQMKRNKHTPRRGNSENRYFLTGMLFCGACGDKMVGSGGTSRAGEHICYYACNSRIKEKTCKMDYIPKDELENMVVGKTIEFFTPNMIENISRVAYDQLLKEESEKPSTDQVNAEIKEIDKNINNILDLMQQGLSNPSLVRRLTELEAEKDDAELRIKEIRKTAEIFSKDMIYFFLERIVNNCLHDEADKALLINTLIRKVQVIKNNDDTYNLDIEYIIKKEPDSQENGSYKVLSGGPERI